MESPSEESGDEVADSLRGQAMYEPSDHGRGVHHKVPGKCYCVCSIKGGGGGCVLPFRLASGWRDRSISCEERILVIIIDEDPWPVPLGRTQGSSPQVSPIIAVSLTAVWRFSRFSCLLVSVSRSASAGLWPLGSCS